MLRLVSRAAAVRRAPAAVLRRAMSAAPSLVQVSRIPEKEQLALVEMQHAPVNALSMPFLKQLTAAFKELEADKSVQGVVLASSIPKIFSAGLDIREMYQKDEAHLREFWGSLQTLWLHLMNSRLAVAAAIEGNSPAGGCMLALTADERIMAKGKFTIGLNETRLGIVAPLWFIDAFRAAVGQRQSERLLQLGEMVTSAEALQLGLVDQVVPVEEVRETAIATLERYLQIPASARHLTKVAARQDIVARLADNIEPDLQRFADFAAQPAVQKGLGKYLESLSARAKK